jgi:hypothetical protein
MLSEDVYHFQKDFDSGKTICEPIGRFVLCSGHVVRLVFTPKGFVISVSQDAIRDGSLYLNPSEDGLIEFAGFGPKPNIEVKFEITADFSVMAVNHAFELAAKNNLGKPIKIGWDPDIKTKIGGWWLECEFGRVISEGIK